LLFEEGECQEAVFEKNKLKKAIVNFEDGAWYYGDFKTNMKDGEGC